MSWYQPLEEEVSAMIFIKKDDNSYQRKTYHY